MNMNMLPSDAGYAKAQREAFTMPPWQWYQNNWRYLTGKVGEFDVNDKHRWNDADHKAMLAVYRSMRGEEPAGPAAPSFYMILSVRELRELTKLAVAQGKARGYKPGRELGNFTVSLHTHQTASGPIEGREQLSSTELMRDAREKWVA